LHLCIVNSNNAANKNFNAFVNSMAVKKSKNDKIIALTKGPESIVVVVDNHKQVKFVHNCKEIRGTCTNAMMMVGALISHRAHACHMPLCQS
jgi:hypothetical protein